MKIKVPGILIFISTFFYLLSVIFPVIEDWGISFITILISLISIGLLIAAAIASSKKNLMFIFVGIFVIINILDALFFSWYGGLFNAISTFLPLNYISGYGRFFAIFADIHVILLMSAVILSLVGKESQTKAQPVPHTYNEPIAPRPVARTSVGIEGDAIAQVQKLGELLKQGLITQDEFEVKKKQILGL